MNNIRIQNHSTLPDPLKPNFLVPTREPIPEASRHLRGTGGRQTVPSHNIKHDKDGRRILVSLADASDTTVRTS